MPLDDVEIENTLSSGNDDFPVRSRSELEKEIEGREKVEIARRWEEYYLLQAQHRSQIDKLSISHMTMFGRTPPEVSVSAFVLAKEEAAQYAGLKAQEGEPIPEGSDIRAFKAQIQNRDVLFYAEGRDRPSFIDDGKRIYVSDYQDDLALLASLQLAQQRWGLVKVRGNADFRDRVVKLAADYDLKLSNPDLAEKVMLMRTAEGDLSAPSAEERQAAAKVEADFKATMPRPPVAPAPAPAKVTQTAPAAAPEAKQPIPAPKAPEQAPSAVEAAPVAATPQPETVGDDKDWIRQLQEERQLQKMAKEREAKMAQEEKQAETTDTVTVAVAADEAPKAAPVEVEYEDEEPESEVDLGFDDDDDFNPLAKPVAAKVVADKAPTATVRP
jgi:hypothetical protein